MSAQVAAGKGTPESKARSRVAARTSPRSSRPYLRDKDLTEGYAWWSEPGNGIQVKIELLGGKTMKAQKSLSDLEWDVLKERGRFYRPKTATSPVS
jgi:hypothetical protein